MSLVTLIASVSGVFAQLQYALLLTQLRFETATLIDSDGESKTVSARDVLSLPFID